jgi:hypothetical protein
MLSQESIHELHTAWLPNITDLALDRLIELLEKGSPLLVHGCFTGSLPMGCLATHAAWHHPVTAHLTMDAGITWLHQVARLNPATSQVIRDWDQQGMADLGLRFELLRYLKEARLARQEKPLPANRTSCLLEV